MMTTSLSMSSMYVCQRADSLRISMISFFSSLIITFVSSGDGISAGIQAIPGTHRASRDGGDPQRALGRGGGVSGSRASVWSEGTVPSSPFVRAQIVHPSLFRYASHC